jgi:phosphopentomutase
MGMYLFFCTGPPFVVHSNKVVQITKDEEEISFKPTIDFVEQKIEVTRVNGLNMARIKLRVYWDEFYAKMQSTEYLNYANLTIEAIFPPL